MRAYQKYKHIYLHEYNYILCTHFYANKKFTYIDTCTPACTYIQKWTFIVFCNKAETKIKT